MNGRVSVIIPVYNRPAELARALSSLASQTQPPWEVIVVDDGSQVDISGVVARYESSLNVKFVRSENFGGPGRPRNIGADLAQGEWLSFLDCDDWWYSERMEVVSRSLTGLAGGLFHRLDRVVDGKPAGSRSGSVGSAFKGELWRRILARGNPVPNSSVVVRRDAYRAVGGMSEDEAMISVEDVDCWIRLSKSGVKFRFIDASLGSYWVGADGISRATRRQFSAQRALYRAHRDGLCEPLASDARSFHAYVMGTHCLNHARKHRRAQAYLRIAALGRPSVVRIKAAVKLLCTLTRSR